MSPRYKMTGCARFLIFLIVFIPLAWIISTYATGEDPLDTMREMWENEELEVESAEELKERIRTLETEIKELETELEERKEQLRKLEE